MRTMSVLKGLFLLVAIMFTTGIILPWVISNVLMPVWMIIFTLGTILALWLIILERPFRKMMSRALKSFQW